MSEMKDKPFVRKESVNMGIQKINTRRLDKGLSKSV